MWDMFLFDGPTVSTFFFSLHNAKTISSIYQAIENIFHL